MRKTVLLLLFSALCFKAFSQEKKEPVESKHQAEIKFEEEAHDFGTIKEGNVVTWEFHFKNIGDSLLILSNVVTSCGCTVPTWPKDPVAPGESGTIKVTFDSKGRPGRFNKVITILSNSKNKIDRVTISGTVDGEGAPALPQK